MAIKVNGTTVIDDSRNLVNIVSGAGASTTTGDVGTHAFLCEAATNRSTINPGGTKAGSSLLYAHIGQFLPTFSATAPSGTWRLMGGYSTNSDYNDYPCSVWLRIS